MGVLSNLPANLIIYLRPKVTLLAAEGSATRGRE